MLRRTAAWTVTAAMLAFPVMKISWKEASGELDANRSNVHVAEGYVDAVKLFIQHRWLVYKGGQVRLDDAYQNDKSSIQHRFYEGSHLKRDVQAFNEGDANDRFIITSNALVGVDEYAHNIELPLAENASWLGTLSYRPQTSRYMVLDGNQSVIRLHPVTKTLSNLHRSPELDLHSRSVEIPRREIDGQAVEIRGDGGTTFAKTFTIGDRGVVLNLGTSDMTGVRINGVSVESGGHGERFQNGDLVRVQWRQQNKPYSYELYVAAQTDGAQTISSFHWANGKQKRVPFNTNPPFGSDVATAVTRALQQADRNGQPFIKDRRSTTEDLNLTLSPTLHLEIQRQLRDFLKKKGLNGSTRAAVTVMDATSGEILALASYPTKADLHGVDSVDQARLLRNHNFSALPIGSAAKPLFAAAIFADPRYSHLQSLEVKGASPRQADSTCKSREFDSVLGINIYKICDLSRMGHQQWIDFDTFIETSSNKYAAALLTLAAEDPAGSETPSVPLAPVDQYRIGKTTYTQLRTKLRFPVAANGSVGQSTTLTNIPLAVQLKALYDIEVTPPSSAPEQSKVQPAPRYWDGAEGNDLLDTGLWRDWIRHMYGNSQIPENHPFLHVAPDRVRIPFRLVKDYRGEYLPLILGGGFSRWTTLQVAEAYSRLATGKKISKRLVYGFDGRRLPEVELAPLPIPQAVRQKVLNAMTLVEHSNPSSKWLRYNPETKKTGPLSDIRSELHGKNLGLVVFSKTGSPEIGLSKPTPLKLLLDNLFAGGVLAVENGRIVANAKSFGSSKREMRTSEGLKELLSDKSARDIISGSDMSKSYNRQEIVRKISNTVLDYNLGSTEQRDDLFYELPGRQLRSLDFAMLPDFGGVYAATFAVHPLSKLRKRPERKYADTVDVTSEPIRAVTVVATIEHVSGSAFPVELVSRLLKEKGPLRNAIMDGWTCPRTDRDPAKECM
ncbi:MAG: hypothetical protein Q7R40_20155 [Phaeospirillum sp.]|nr:hypothetical protein [Phaeospirillum sp.]